MVAATRPALHAGVLPANVFCRDDIRGDTVLGCDVVIVGSGAGGATAAAELAEAGLDVIVVEEGRYYGTRDFTADASAMIRAMYRDGGATMAFGDPPILYQEGRVVGGSTVVNGGMSWRTPPKILDRWHREDGLDGIRAAAMEPLFERVERRIHVAHQDPGTIGRDNQLLKEGADAMGWKVIPNLRNQVHCAGSNNCAFGCPTGAKQSALVSYIPRALHFGARVYSDVRVAEITRAGKRATGIEGRVVRANGTLGHKLVVRARLVISACGAIHTPALLHRSGFRSPSGRLGGNLGLHPNCKLIAIFDEDVRGWEGVHQAFQVREFQDEGFLFAAVNVPPSILAMSAHEYGAELGELMAQYNQMVVAGMLVEDTPDRARARRPHRPAAGLLPAERLRRREADPRHRPALGALVRRRRQADPPALRRGRRSRRPRRRAKDLRQPHPQELDGGAHRPHDGHRADGRRPLAGGHRRLRSRLRRRPAGDLRRQLVPLADRGQPDGDDPGVDHPQRGPHPREPKEIPAMRHATPTSNESLPGVSSDRVFELEKMSPKELETVFLRGVTPDLDALAGWQFRGLNAPAWAKLAGIKKFIKGFFREGDDLYGYNCPVVQNRLREPWVAKPDDARPKRFGFYRVAPVDPTARDNAYLHAVLLDYGQGPKPTKLWDPTRGLRDYLVQVDADNPDLFLGKAYYALGPVRVPTSFFILERHRRAD